jgi:hypothetical protein
VDAGPDIRMLPFQLRAAYAIVMHELPITTQGCKRPEAGLTHTEAVWNLGAAAKCSMPVVSNGYTELHTRDKCWYGCVISAVLMSFRPMLATPDGSMSASMKGCT